MSDELAKRRLVTVICNERSGGGRAGRQRQRARKTAAGIADEGSEDDEGCRDHLGQGDAVQELAVADPAAACGVGPHNRDGGVGAAEGQKSRFQAGEEKRGG